MEAETKLRTNYFLVLLRKQPLILNFFSKKQLQTESFAVRVVRKAVAILLEMYNSSQQPVMKTGELGTGQADQFSPHVRTASIQALLRHELKPGIDMLAAQYVRFPRMPLCLPENPSSLQEHQ